VGGGETTTTTATYTHGWEEGHLPSGSYKDASYRGVNRESRQFAAVKRMCPQVRIHTEPRADGPPARAAGYKLEGEALSRLLSTSPQAIVDLSDPTVSAAGQVVAYERERLGGGEPATPLVLNHRKRILSALPSPANHQQSDGGGDDEPQNVEEEVETTEYDEQGQPIRTVTRRSRRTSANGHGGRANGKQAAVDARAQQEALQAVAAAPPLSGALAALTLHDNALYTGNALAPRVNDERITFKTASAGPASVLGAWAAPGQAIAPWKASNGREVLLVERGIVSRSDLIAHAHSANVAMTWLFRGLGWVVLLVAWALILAPLSVAPEVVPLVGGLASAVIGCGTSIVGGVAATVIALCTVAVSWLAVRPQVRDTGEDLSMRRRHAWPPLRRCRSRCWARQRRWRWGQRC